MWAVCWFKASSQAIKLSERAQELAAASKSKELAPTNSAPSVSAPSVSAPVVGSSPMPMDKEEAGVTSSQVQSLRPC